jgi:hypothetical protein
MIEKIFFVLLFPLLLCLVVMFMGTQGLSYIYARVRERIHPKFQFYRNKRWTEKNLISAEVDYEQWRWQHPGVHPRNDPVGEGLLLRLSDDPRDFVHLQDCER